CSASCGSGWTERQVQCISAEGEVSENCSSSSKPEELKSCISPSCHFPTNCRDVRLQKGIVSDGEQTLKIDGKMLK
ncbi:hypothetical protein cypCar_00004864, partial [Cyprinus carpio]